MNKKFLLLLIPITTLVLSGCGKRSPGGSTSGDDPTTAQPTSGATTGSPTSGTTGGSSGTTGTTGGSSTTGSSSSSSSGSSSSSSSSSVIPVPTEGLAAAYEAAAALAEGAESTEKYSFSGTIVAIAKNSLYVQDGSYGLYVFSSSAIENAAVGKTINVTATVKNYYQVLETGTVDSAVVGADASLPSALIISSQSVIDNAKQNILAQLHDSELVTKGTWSGSSNGICTFRAGSDTVTVKFDKNSFATASADSKTAYTSMNVGDHMDLSNVVTTVYSSSGTVSHQLLFVSSSTLAAHQSSVTLESISISNAKTSYLQGDTFVKPVVTAHYSNETENEVTASATFTGYDLSSTGNQTVTVSYTEGGQTRTTTYSINVAADELQSIAIDGSMTDTSYAIGDSWNPAGLTVTGTYSSGNKDVTSLVEWSYSPLTPEAAGVGESTLEVTASLSGKSDSKQVIVEVTAAESSLKQAYDAAAALATGASTSSAYTFSGTVVAIVGNTFVVQDGSYGMYVYNKAVTGNAVGKEVSVTATLKNYRTMFETDSISAATLVGDGTPQTSANLTSLASLTALNQNLLAHTTAQFVSTETAWTSSVNGFSTFKIGDDNVKVKFDKYGYDADKAAVLSAATAGDTFNLTGLITSKFDDVAQLLFMGTSAIAKVEKEIDSISISTHPTMLSYVVGDHFDPTGLVIDVLYEDDSHDSVPYAGNEAKFSFSPSLTTALATSDTSVAITYGGKTANETISVVEDTLQEIVISGDMTKKSYSAGDAWDPSGLVATGNYNISGAKVLTDVDWAYSPETALAGTTSVNVTASKAGVTSAAFTVNGITVSAAEEHTVSWTASSGALGSSISTVGGTATGHISTGSLQWDYTRTLKSGTDTVGWQGGQGAIQLGKNGGVENAVFSTSNIPGTVKSVAIECASYQAKHTISITVGGISYFSGDTPAWGSGAVSTISGTGTSSGEIVISFGSGTRALYVKSITVVYEA